MDPVINCEEEIGKTVGRRRSADPLETAGRLNEMAAELMYAAKLTSHIRPGVYRFKTHEEADEWMLKMQARRGMLEKT